MHFVAFLFTKATEMSLHAVTNDSRPPPGRVGPLHPSSHGTSSGGLLHPSSGEVGTGEGGDLLHPSSWGRHRNRLSHNGLSSARI